MSSNVEEVRKQEPRGAMTELLEQCSRARALLQTNKAAVLRLQSTRPELYTGGLYSCHADRQEAHGSASCTVNGEAMPDSERPDLERGTCMSDATLKRYTLGRPFTSTARVQVEYDNGACEPSLCNRLDRPSRTCAIGRLKSLGIVRS